MLQAWLDLDQSSYPELDQDFTAQLQPEESIMAEIKMVVSHSGLEEDGAYFTVLMTTYDPAETKAWLEGDGKGQIPDEPDSD
jgi:hypothetical protein